MTRFASGVPSGEAHRHLAVLQGQPSMLQLVQKGWPTARHLGQDRIAGSYEQATKEKTHRYMGGQLDE